MTEDKDMNKGEIRDPDEIVQSRRLNSIFDIRKEIRETRKIILMETYDNRNLSKFEALSGYRTLANNYLMELEPLLLKFDPGETLLKKEDFGTAVFQPHYEKTEKASFGRGRTTAYKIIHQDGDTTEIKRKPEQQSIELTGLQSLWEVPDPIEIRLKAKQDSNSRGIAIEQPITYKTQFSVQTTDKFIRCMNRYLSNIGFELDPEEDKEPHQI